MARKKPASATTPLRKRSREARVVNSRTTAKQFEKIMHYRNLSLVYGLKQAAKSVLPANWYQKVRDRLYAQ